MRSPSLFLSFLNQHDDDAWLRVVDRLDPSIHAVDRTAARIWFHFYPLALDQAMARAPRPDRLADALLLKGRWRLADQIDASHYFLYGHCHWPAVHRDVLAYATRATSPGSLDLGAQIQEIARETARELRVDVSVLLGITAVGLRTLQQVGPEAFAAASAAAPRLERNVRVTPEQVLAARARNDRQGLLGWMRGERREWTVVFDERDPACRFPLIHSQHLTTAAALDSREHRGRDASRSEGPIPVQCRSCSCGDVLGGRDRRRREAEPDGPARARQARRLWVPGGSRGGAPGDPAGVCGPGVRCRIHRHPSLERSARTAEAMDLGRGTTRAGRKREGR